MAMGMSQLSHRNNSSNSNSNISNNIDNSRVKALVVGPRRVSLNVGNARWRGIERGRTTFIIRAGSSGDALHFKLYASMSDFMCCMPFPPSLLSFFFNHLLGSLSISHSSRISLSFLGIALYIKSCLEPHRIRTTHVPSTVLVSFLSCRYSSLSPSPPASPSASFWAFACSRPGGEVLCLILFLPLAVLCCLVAFLVDRLPLSFSVSSFVVYSFLS